LIDIASVKRTSERLIIASAWTTGEVRPRSKVPNPAGPRRTPRATKTSTCETGARSTKPETTAETRITNPIAPR